MPARFDRRIADGLSVFYTGLRNFVEERMRLEYRDGWEENACRSLGRSQDRMNLDVSSLIRVALDKQHQVLYNSLSSRERNFLHELRDVRNRYAHQEIFEERDVERALDTMELLLRAIQSPQAEIVAALRRVAATPLDLSEGAKVEPPKAEPHKYDWVYFSTDSRWNLEGFRRFVERERLIVRTIHNKAHIPIPNVLQLKAGERILLLYKAKGKPYCELFGCTIGRSPRPVQAKGHVFDVFARIDSFDEELSAAKFDRDPVVGSYTGIWLSESPKDLHSRELDVQKPVPMMAIQRWNEVFSHQGI